MDTENENHLKDREIQLMIWLRKTVSQDFNLSHLAADAGARRYFRITLEGQPSRVVMDAPPQLNNLERFCQIADLIRNSGLNAPKILHKNLDDGFLVLSDFGDSPYIKELNLNTANTLFDHATTALVQMQNRIKPDSLGKFGETSMLHELRLFEDWYLAKHLNLKLDTKQTDALKTTFNLICQKCSSQETVFTHRDYMPRNLMVCETTPGILDFQDAQSGPITYDIISLFKDAFLSWEEERVLDWSIRYWEKARSAKLPVRDDFGVFFEDMEWMGLQRHLKVLGVFSRLKYRDQKPHYLEDESRFLGYIRETASRYDAFTPLLHILDLIEGVERKAQHTF